MERFNVIKDFCQVNNIPQIQNSWIKTAGDYLNIPQLPGNDDYEQRVFVSVIGTGDTTLVSRIESPDTFTYVECLDGTLNIFTEANIANVIQLSSSGELNLIANTQMNVSSDQLIINSTGSITIGSQGDLIYTGNSAVSFNSLGSIAFTSEGGLVFTDTTTNFVQFVMSLPTVDIGLATGQLYTQTATELGGSGTQKVLCIK